MENCLPNALRPLLSTPTLFEGNEFQGRDLLETIAGFGSPVCRTYTLHVATTMFSDGRQPPSTSHILGWDHTRSDWIYNETNWRTIDQMLHLARQYGVRIIVPIINQDYGSSDSDWVGNFNDLIRHRYGIQNYTDANRAVDWFTDRAMINSYKQLITFYLNRINTFNGIRIGDDETVLAFETGNEMNWGNANRTIFRRPAPASWTVEIAQHIKSLAPNTLVMDGSYSRNAKDGLAWEEDTLNSKYVDLFSYHIYGAGDLELLSGLTDQVRAHKKTFILGEHGFYSDPKVYRSLYNNLTSLSCAGAMVWSLRSHSENGGFVTHGEGNNIYSYHAPGWVNQTSEKFDIQEAEVISSTYDASFETIGLEAPLKPIPRPPEAFLVTNGTHAGLSWRGSAWAKEYQVLGAVVEGFELNVISKALPDNVQAGTLFVPLDPSDPIKPIQITLPEPILPRSQEGWTDTKWCVPGSTEKCWDTRFPREHTLFSKYVPDGSEPSVYRPATPSTRIHLKPLSTVAPETLQPSISGGWFSVRAISADGIPGGLSASIFLAAQ